MWRALGFVFLLLTAGSQADAVARELRWARSADAATLDPHATNDAITNNLLYQVYEPLLIRRGEGKLEPALATHWQQAADPTVWEFTLRKNVLFHDGTTLSADDVLFSLKRAQNSRTPVRLNLTTVIGFAKKDDNIISIKTSSPDPILPAKLTNVFVVSRAWVVKNANGKTDEENVAGGFFAKNENGTGPYKITAREIDVKTTLTRFDGYWDKSKKGFDVISYLPVRSAATRIAALLSGDVDFVQDVAVQDVARLQSQAAVRVRSGPENRTVFLSLNVDPKNIKNFAGKNPLAEPKVREAIDLAIDRAALTKGVMRGLAVPLGTYVPPFVSGYERTQDIQVKPDLKRARELLAEAGYPSGFRLVLHCSNDRLPNDEAICTALANALDRIGIKTTPVARPFAVHLPAMYRAETDFYLMSTGFPTFDSSFNLDLFVHSRTATGGGSINVTGYKNPDVDRDIEAIATSADNQQRIRLMQAVWKRVKQDRPYIPLYGLVSSYAMAPFIDIPVDPSGIVYFKYVKGVHVVAQ